MAFGHFQCIRQRQCADAVGETFLDDPRRGYRIRPLAHGCAHQIRAGFLPQNLARPFIKDSQHFCIRIRKMPFRLASQPCGDSQNPNWK